MLTAFSGEIFETEFSAREISAVFAFAELPKLKPLKLFLYITTNYESGVIFSNLQRFRIKKAFGNKIAESLFRSYSEVLLNSERQIAAATAAKRRFGCRFNYFLGFIGREFFNFRLRVARG